MKLDECCKLRVLMPLGMFCFAQEFYRLKRLSLSYDVCICIVDNDHIEFHKKVWSVIEEELMETEVYI